MDISISSTSVTSRRMNELASALRVDPSTVTRTMQRMEVAGLADAQSPAMATAGSSSVEITSRGGGATPPSLLAAPDRR